MEKTIEDRIKEILEKLRPYIMDDGGDIEFVKYENGICYLKFLGYCANCSMRMFTLDELFKESLVNEIDEITDVVLINE